MIKFTLIGDGQAAKYHRKAIEHVGGEIVSICDPAKYPGGVITNDGIKTIALTDIDTHTDIFVICSPSYMHREQIKHILAHGHGSAKIICEKPAFLPWENIIDDDRINIVLQLRYLPDLPDKAEKVVAHFVRDEAYFNSWKGDPKKTGGLFYNLFIHYISLAIQLGADFEGSVQSDGTQNRYIEFGTFGLGRIDLLNIDMQACYNLLYEDILSGGGIKPKDIFYLNWVLSRNSELFGYGKDAMGATIKIGKELL